MQLADTGQIDVFDVGLAALSGAAGGALSATGLGCTGQAIGNAVISGVSETISQIKNGNRDLGSILYNAGVMAATGAASVIIGGKGIRAEGTPYREGLDTLNTLKGNYTKAVSNPKGFINELNTAINNLRFITRSEVKSTTISFGVSNFLSNFICRVKNNFRRWLVK